MKIIYLFIFVVAFIFISAAKADIRMDSLGSNDNGNPVFTITGSDLGYFHLYLQCFWYESLTITGEKWMDVTDLGVTPQQSHLYRIGGLDGSLFWISDWDAYAIEVLDLSMSRVGVYSEFLDGYFHADAGGPYRIAAGQSVVLDSSQSYLAMECGWNPAASLEFPTHVYAEWKIDGKSVGSDAVNVTFNDLVSTFGLNYGIHTVQLDAYTEYQDVIGFIDY